MEYTLKSILNELSQMGDEKRKQHNKKQGADDNQFGVALGNIRALAKKIGISHKLAFELWSSKNYDAMILSCMLFDSRLISESDFEALVKDAYVSYLVDELTFRVLGGSSHAKSFMHRWTKLEDEKYGRAGWNLAISLVSQDKLADPEMEELLSYIEKNLKQALPQRQWAMNHCMCEIGIRYDRYTDRCISLGEKLGVYRDMKVSKGCTSAYAPEWIGVVRSKRKK